MKLQPKRAIQADLATQRKQQIDEGIKLASKVDVLRETLVQEEGNLKRFRAESIATAQADIDRYIGYKEELEREIKVLETLKQVVQIPLDAEWEKLRFAEKKFGMEKEAWGEKSESLEERLRQVERSEQEIEINKIRVKDLNKRASVSLTEAAATLDSARESAADIRNKAHATLLAAEAKEYEQNIRQKELEKLENKLGLIEKNQSLKDLEQQFHDRTIKDKYATLERTIKRMSKNV